MTETATAATETDSLRAFVVTSDLVEVSTIVFAGRHGEAKSMAFGSDWFADSEWTELKCRRKVEADSYAAQFGRGVVLGYAQAEQRMMRDLGWYQVEGHCDECEGCGLFPWDDLPESYLRQVGERIICGECAEKS